MRPEITLGYYKHFKGSIYQVFGLVRHSETREWMVSYGKGQPQEVREINMFKSDVSVNNQLIPRFKFLTSVCYALED